MQDILQEITSHKREEIERLYKKKVSLRDALLASDTGIIAEFKRRSPSKGWIKEDGKADEIPISYQQNGAAAISILTDEHYFGGHDEFITSARRSGVTIPILYKNFVIDEAQIYAAAICGASAILLIAACLTKARCKMLIDKAHDLGLEVLLEMHSEEELEYAELNPDLCGINNRNLGTFVTDVQNSFRLAELLPKDSVKVSESGISNPQTIRIATIIGTFVLSPVTTGLSLGSGLLSGSDPGSDSGSDPGSPGSLLLCSEVSPGVVTYSATTFISMLQGISSVTAASPSIVSCTSSPASKSHFQYSLKGFSEYSGRYPPCNTLSSCISTYPSVRLFPSESNISTSTGI